MKLLPNEEVITSSDAQNVILTTERIYRIDAVWGSSYQVSICLEDISSIESKYTSRVWLIVIAVVVVAMGFAFSDRNSSALMGSIVIAIACIIAWYMSRRHIISISSDGGAALNFEVTGMSTDAIDDFIYNVSLAKAAKVKRVFGV